MNIAKIVLVSVLIVTGVYTICYLAKFPDAVNQVQPVINQIQYGNLMETLLDFIFIAGRLVAVVLASCALGWLLRAFSVFKARSAGFTDVEISESKEIDVLTVKRTE
jgi:large-conductance mechanosensitive channel